MREEYDFSQGGKNPYAKTRKATITIRLDQATVDYFKELGEEVSIPYQTLINSYLANCANNKIKPDVVWRQ